MTESNKQIKPQYKKPTLKTLGSFTQLTQMQGSKGGAKNDGSGVPRSRL